MVKSSEKNCLRKKGEPASWAEFLQEKVAPTITTRFPWKDYVVFVQGGGPKKQRLVCEDSENTKQHKTGVKGGKVYIEKDK